MYAVELENISKAFKNHQAVDNLSLTVPKGSIYGFIGPNGSGKTTTIRMIMNILYPDNGTITILGKEHFGSRFDNVGYLPEERGLYKKMKVKELLKFHATLKKTKQVKKQISYWLEKLDLSEWADKKVETLSKGMSQKLQFIVTIIDQPDIIILDEPFTGLDPVNAEIIRSVILELQQSGTTIIFSTHDMNMAERLCDYIFMIYKGKKVLDGTLNSIKEIYGTDTLRLRTGNGKASLEGIKGIEKVNDFGQEQEIRISKELNPQIVLAEIMKKTNIMKFEISTPSLNDIFIRIANPKEKETENV